MSKVLPAKYETEGNCDNVCPRYKKWINRTTNDGACRQPEKGKSEKVQQFCIFLYFTFALKPFSRSQQELKFAHLTVQFELILAPFL